jgi:hypothetical protein
MIQYLVANTTVKEELAAGFGGARGPALNSLVQAVDLPAAGKPSQVWIGNSSFNSWQQPTNRSGRKSMKERK